MCYLLTKSCSQGNRYHRRLQFLKLLGEAEEEAEKTMTLFNMSLTKLRIKRGVSKLAEFKDYQDDEINSLFDDARKELAKVDENAKELKKNIVIKLAKKLEEKIRIDTICIEIV